MRGCALYSCGQHKLFKLISLHAICCLGAIVLVSNATSAAEPAHGKDDAHVHAENGDTGNVHHEHDSHDDAHHDDHDAHGGASHGDDTHHAGEHGAPNIWEDLSFWSIIAFAGFVLAIAKLGLWDSLKTNMAKREASETHLIAAAEGELATVQESVKQFRGQLEAMDETTTATLAEAQRDADHTRQDLIDTANREASQMLHRAEHEIARSRDQSLNNLFEHMANRVCEAAEARVRSGLQGADQDRLIDDTLNQFASS